MSVWKEESFFKSDLPVYQKILLFPVWLIANFYTWAIYAVSSLVTLWFILLAVAFVIDLVF